jgi:hypothetical protein
VDKRKELAGGSVQTVYRISDKGRTTYGDYLGFLEAMVLNARQGGNEMNKALTAAVLMMAVFPSARPRLCMPRLWMPRPYSTGWSRSWRRMITACWWT